VATSTKFAVSMVNITDKYYATEGAKNKSCLVQTSFQSTGNCNKICKSMFLKLWV